MVAERTESGVLRVGPIAVNRLEWAARGVLTVLSDRAGQTGLVLLPARREQLPYEPGFVASEDGSMLALLREHSFVSVDLPAGEAFSWTLDYEGELQSIDGRPLPDGWLSPNGDYLVLTFSAGPEHEYAATLRLGDGKIGLDLSTESEMRVISWSPDGTEIVLEECLYSHSGNAEGYYHLVDVATGSDEVVRWSPSLLLHPDAVNWTASGVQILPRGAEPTGEEAFCFDPAAGRKKAWTDDRGLSLTSVDIIRDGQTTTVDLTPLFIGAGIDTALRNDTNLLRTYADWMPGLTRIWLSGLRAWGWPEDRTIWFYGSLDVETQTGVLRALPDGMTSRVLAFAQDGSRVFIVRSPDWDAAPEAENLLGLYSVDPATLEEVALSGGEIQGDLGSIEGVCLLTTSENLLALDPAALTCLPLASAPISSVESLADGRVLVSRPGEVLSVSLDGKSSVSLLTVPEGDDRGEVIHAWPTDRGILVLTEHALGYLADPTNAWTPVLEAPDGQAYQSFAVSPDADYLAIVRQGAGGDEAQSYIDIVPVSVH